MTILKAVHLLNRYRDASITISVDFVNSLKETDYSVISGRTVLFSGSFQLCAQYVGSIHHAQQFQLIFK